MHGSATELDLVSGDPHLASFRMIDFYEHLAGAGDMRVVGDLQAPKRMNMNR